MGIILVFPPRLYYLQSAMVARSTSGYNIIIRVDNFKIDVQNIGARALGRRNELQVGG